jgi:AraC family transcriptional regulator
MSPPDPVRIVDHPLMLVAGIRQPHSFTDCAQTIPLQWDAFRELGAPPGAIPGAAYGVMCGLVPGGFEYMTGMEVRDFTLLPPALARMRVVAHRYAVFEHRGHVSGIQSAWRVIWNEWLPGSGLRNANTPDFERYDARFDPAMRSGVVELWCPIVPA